MSSPSLRGGYEYYRYDQTGEPAVGSGAIGGFTVKLGKYDINANLTYRQKPVRQLPGYTIPNIKFLIGLKYHPEFLTR